MLYLLSGLPCSGKSTYAQGLSAQGVARVDVDKMMIDTAGRIDVDYPASMHLELLQPVFRAAVDRVRNLLIARQDVVLDHGLGRKDERDRLKRLAGRYDADWTLLQFDVDVETLRVRCAERYSQPGAVPLTDAALDYLIESFEPPTNEGEVTIDT